ncbi:MAG TPA: glycosyltransferase family 1 protein [Vicinamibacterales bacterium]
MRIAVDARELGGRPTGVGRYLQQLLREWARTPSGHSFTLFTPDPALQLPTGLIGDVAVVPGAGGTGWEQRALARAVRRARPDVLFAPGYTAPLLVRCPVALVVHDVSFAAHPEWFRPREGFRRRLLCRLSARRARVVVTVSAFSKREIETHLHVPADRIRVIPHGVGLGPSAGSGRREPLVLFVGSVFNRRHVPALITAFGRLAASRPDLRLEIVGENRTWPPQDLRQAAVASGAASRIGLRDWVPDDTLADLYQRASAFVFLSEYEGFGLTPLEALAAGIPPVVLDTPVAREVYGPAAIYVSRAEPDAIAHALEQALDPGPARDQVFAAAPGVLARYRWEDAAAATLAAICEAAS